MNLLQLFFLFLPMLTGQQPAHKPSDKIQKEELSAYLAKEFDCEADEPIYFWVLEPYDFLGKGYDQAVVVASTCMTGTAGPDVHAVFTRDENGELKELKIVQGTRSTVYCSGTRTGHCASRTDCSWRSTTTRRTARIRW